MKMKLLSVLVASSIGAATPALAVDNPDIMKRLDQLEMQRKADQAEIQSLRNKVQQLETNKAAPVSSSEATKLREEIEKANTKTAKRIDSVKKSIEHEQDKLKINGYMSVYGVKSTDKYVTLDSGVDNHIGFNSDTIAGIQFTYKMDDQFDAVVQFRSEGRNDYTVETPWAFLRYKVTPSTTLRFGRLVAPLYLYADSIDVGYTYPWVRPPVEMYNTSSSLLTGVDLIQAFNFGNWNNTIQVVFADNDGSVGDLALKTNYFAGTVLTLNNDAWTFRVAGFNVDGLQIGTAEDSLQYYAGAIRFDDGSLLVIAEGRKIDSGEKLQTVLSDSDGFYVTTGYQLDRFMPYATWAKTYTTDESLAPGLLQQSQESVGLGLRYNLTDKVVIKSEVTQYDHFDGTAGTSGMATLPGGPTSAPINLPILQKLDEDGATVMSLGIDAIF